MVPRRGLEPPHPKAHGPEPCASTNSATWALCQEWTISHVGHIFDVLCEHHSLMRSHYSVFVFRKHVLF